MKNHYMKIREKFISEIRSGNKKHEYRLASPERMQIKVGDTLVLISNQNKQNFVKTTVKSISTYKGWEDAIRENWNDFSHLYYSPAAALRECNKFYSKDEVNTYGIVVFEVEPLKTRFNNISVLLDTNIIIKRESGNNVSYEVASLFNWFSKKSTSSYIHPLSKNELSGYGDEKAKATMLTKLNSYDTFPQFTHIEDSYFDYVVSQYSQDKNGKIDNALLREVYDDNVSILLSDDFLILKKAEELYIRDRVVTSSELLAYFETIYPQNIEYKMLAVKLKPLSEIDLNSSFFDSLREDYGGVDFDRWFKKKAQKGEKAYVFENNDGLQGFLYLKTEGLDEIYLDIKPQFKPKNRLKVGTFKINASGFRLGERFLKIIFDNARQYKVDEIYVTLFEHKRDGVKRLKQIMEEWGFIKFGEKNNGEIVLVKSLEKYNPKCSPKQNFPLLETDCKHYFLPIEPQYHTDLFPDNILKNENMHLYKENKAHRYALEKIYLSGAFNIKAKPGDLVLIYRKGERYPKKYSSVVSGVAIIEDIIYTNDADECIKICKNRSIFTEDEIIELYSKYPVIVKLLDFVSFKNKVTLNQLYNQGIVDEGTGPRPFTWLKKEGFEKIYKLGME